MSNNHTIAELVKQASAGTRVTASNYTDNVIKTAHEQGIVDAERVAKVASYTGDIMGNQAYEAFHGRVAESLGFNPEAAVVKQASLTEMFDVAMYASLEKIAEAYSPQTGGANLASTVAAGQDQLREAGKASAVLAAQSAQDAIASADMGDANTAQNSIVAAGQNIALARQAAGVVNDPELNAQLNQAAAIVSNAAQAIQATAAV